MSRPGTDADQARAERRAERRVAALFTGSSVCAVALAIVYWLGGQPQLEGLFLGLALTGLACGFVVWGNRLLPQGPVTGERHQLASAPEEVRAVEHDLDSTATTRRSLVLRSLALAAGGLGLAAVFPIRSLGPRPGRSLYETPWRRGMRLVTADGRPVLAADVPVESLATVFPESDPGSSDGQAVLIRVDPGLIRPKPGREDWSPGGLVAYSKICTHAGCPVGLYEVLRHELLCPCHQSTFDVLNHAQPGTGPAAAPLPQLPLQVDPEGFVVAGGDFSDPVGPAFWRRS